MDKVTLAWQRLGRPLALVVLGAMGCMTNPNNGTTISGSAEGDTQTFSGYYNEPNIPIEVQILYKPDADPTVSSNWKTVGTAVSSSSPTSWNDPDPLYAWSLSAVPVPVGYSLRWPAGGVARIRAVAHDPDGDMNVYVFDDDYNSCLGENLDESWKTIGSRCATPYAIEGATVQVSTSPTPTDSGRTNPPYLSRLGVGTPTETAQYYTTINAPATLAAFRLKYGFNLLVTDQVSAIFYNNGDLGLARSMRCKSFSSSSGTGQACYVANYGRDSTGKVVFGLDANAALTQAINNTNPIATVAMVYTPPITAPNSIQFIVYDGSGNLTNEAPLDSTGYNTSVPQNCMSCHAIAGAYNTATNEVTGAHFLPFDVFSFKYSTTAGYTYADQEEKLRKLNAHALAAGANTAITDMINGMYGGNVNDPAAVAVDTYIPAGWQDSSASKKLYNNVVKPYCRTCHVAADSAPYNWTQYSDFTSLSSIIKSDVCDQNTMPHAERTLRLFWQSPARAHLIAGLGLKTACKPIP